ncbi:MAG: hypothetical protein P4L79_02025 [Legionella sp.]|uniref:hypothetical protein n=1 Tax=Legionella sp. TaxID=459 RepID=UPI00284FCCAC|nr:hypothetical protein [Legionella sp.]
MPYSIHDTSIFVAQNKKVYFVSDRKTSLEEVPFPHGEIAHIYAGGYNDYSIFVVTQRGELYVYGDNTHNNLGVDTPHWVNEWQKVHLDHEVEKVFSRENYTALLTKNGTVYIAGSDYSTLFIKLNMDTYGHVLQLAAAKDYLLILTRKGLFDCRFKSPDCPITPIYLPEQIIKISAYEFESIISTKEGVFTYKEFKSALWTQISEETFVDIGSGIHHHLALTKYNELFGWGMNHAKPLGTETGILTNHPKQLFSSIHTFHCGPSSTLLLTGDSENPTMYLLGKRPALYKVIEPYLYEAFKKEYQQKSRSKQNGNLKKYLTEPAFNDITFFVPPEKTSEDEGEKEVHVPQLQNQH